MSGVHIIPTGLVTSQTFQIPIKFNQSILHISLYYSDIHNLPLNPSKPYLPSLNLRRVFGKNKTFTAVTFRGLSQHTRDTSKSRAVEKSTTVLFSVVSFLHVAIKKVEVSIFFYTSQPCRKTRRIKKFVASQRIGSISSK